MFLVNSRSHLVTATPTSLESKSHHQQRRTFSRSYGTNLPSSFTRVFSSALGFSPHPPVLVYGTVPCYLKLRGFSWKHGINQHLSQQINQHLSQHLSQHLFQQIRRRQAQHRIQQVNQLQTQHQILQIPTRHPFPKHPRLSRQISRQISLQ